VKSNRSIPSATVVPVLIYPDVRAAVAWLGEAFGFAERLRIGEDRRTQLSVGDEGATTDGWVVVPGAGQRAAGRFWTPSPDRAEMRGMRSATEVTR
jgi:hypothetical protein